jgi:hypothetical protein
VIKKKKLPAQGFEMNDQVAFNKHALSGFTEE